MGVHVEGDQGLGPLGDRPFERLQAGEDVVGRVDRLADVVEQRGEEELLVVAPLVAGQLEDLEAVVEGVSFGVVLRPLLHAFERLEQHPVELEAVDVVLDALDLEVEVDVGVLGLERGLQLGDRGPLDRPAGDGGFEHVMDLVLGVERQLEGEAVVDVDVGEDTLLAVLDDPLLLDSVGQGGSRRGCR